MEIARAFCMQFLRSRITPALKGGPEYCLQCVQIFVPKPKRKAIGNKTCTHGRPESGLPLRAGGNLACIICVQNARVIVRRNSAFLTDAVWLISCVKQRAFSSGLRTRFCLLRIVVGLAHSMNLHQLRHQSCTVKWLASVCQNTTHTCMRGFLHNLM